MGTVTPVLSFHCCVGFPETIFAHLRPQRLLTCD
jgi:hypothetical protein